MPTTRTPLQTGLGQGAVFIAQPEQVTICCLATALVAPPPPASGWGFDFNGPSAQRQLALFLLEEIHDVSTPTLSPLPVLLKRLQQQLGPAGTFLSRIMLDWLQGLTTPDHMVSLAGRIGALLAPPGSTPARATDADSISFISTSSALGVFMRRVRLALSSMSLQALAALAASLQQQVQAAINFFQQQQEQQEQAITTPTATTAAAAGGPSIGPGSSSSSSSTGSALKEPALLDAYLNTLLATVQGLGACLPTAALEAAAAPLSQLQGSFSKLDYLNLAVQIAHKDLNASLSALHKYFDSSGSSKGASMGGSSSLASGGALLMATSSSTKGKGQHQAALHSLASLQAALGHPQEALAALQELLRLGQQQGDEWGLLHGLASLCRVMGASEGLQGVEPQPGQRGSRAAAASGSAAAAGSAVGGSGSSSSGPGSWCGWGLLDLRRTEQQLQLQALLQRCLDTARDMRAPHIAAFAAVALCRFKLEHASTGCDGAAVPSAVPGIAAEQAGRPSAAAGAATMTLTVQRMLLDVCTLEHQAAIAAAAPGISAAAAFNAAVAGAAPGQGLPAALAGARSSELYNPTEAFGTGTSTASPGSVSAVGPSSSKAQPPGMGWSTSAAAVSHALASAHAVAAAALQLQGASTLAGVRCLMLLTASGGAGVHGSAWTAAVAAAATAAATNSPTQSAADAGSSKPKPAAAAATAADLQSSSAAFTGCSVTCEDVVSGWVQLVLLVQELQGVSAARFVLNLAESHFPHEPPKQLVVVREVLRLKAAIHSGQLPEAWGACEELQGLASPIPQLGVELQLAAAEAHVQVLQAAGCWAESHAAAAALFATAAGAGMQPQAISALLMMARACLEASDAAGALPYVLSALLHCQALQLDGLVPEAVLLMAAAWQALAPDGTSFVMQLLQLVLPLAHAAGKLKVRGDINEAVAKLELALGSEGRQHQQSAAGPKPDAAVVAADGSSQASCRVNQEVLHRAGQHLTAAAAMFEQAEDWKAAAGAWMILAHVYNAAGLEQQRNDAADRWQLCTQRCSATCAAV